MDCAALYLRYCPLEIWYYVILAFAIAVTMWFWERGVRPIPRKGWFGNFLFVSCAAWLILFAFDYAVGFRRTGTLPERIERCSAGHTAEFEKLCSLSGNPAGTGRGSRELPVPQRSPGLH